MVLDRFLDLFAIGFYVLVPYLAVLVIPMYGRLIWLALWSTFEHTKILLIDILSIIFLTRSATVKALRF